MNWKTVLMVVGSIILIIIFGVLLKRYFGQKNTQIYFPPPTILIPEEYSTDKKNVIDDYMYDDVV